MPANTVWLRISMMATDIDTAEIHKGTTAIPYEPFGTTHAIPLGRTVYGGTVDAVRGKLIEKIVSVDMGDITWTYASGQNPPVFRVSTATLGCKQNDVTNLKSSMYKTYSSGWEDFMVSVGTNYLSVSNSNYTDATAFKNAMSGVQLVYELATPVEYDLTETEIKSLLGDNNVWTDTNGNITVAYCADTKLYIDKKLSEL